MENKDRSFYSYVSNNYPQDEQEIDWNFYDKKLSHLVDHYIEYKLRNTLQYNQDLKSNDKNKININLQHDAHNNLDRISDKLYQLDKWARLQQDSFPYILAEYLRTHIKEMRETINQYYLLLKSEE